MKETDITRRIKHEQRIIPVLKKVFLSESVMPKFSQKHSFSQGIIVVLKLQFQNNFLKYLACF
jgi:hypothetical protein